MRRLMGVLILFAGLLVVTSAPAAATSTWTPDPVAAPRVPNGELDGVSCLSGNQCVAVGAYTDRAGMQRSLAQNWDGTTWTVAAPPAGSAAGPETALSGVSCVSATFCAAVGISAPGTGQQTLAEHWTGATWAIDPVGIAGQLNSVSCVSATFCVAVGEDAAKTGIILAWDGSAWSRQLPADPGAQYEVSYNGVSCYSLDGCTAVGSSQRDTTVRPEALALRWNGVAWSDAEALVGSGGSRLAAVSCVARRICFAVGIDRVNSARAYAEESTSAGWQALPVPRWHGQYESLTSISCRSTSFCAAVGNSVVIRSSAPASVFWDGTQWTYLPAHGGGSDDRVFAGISCPSTRTCLGVGHTAIPQQFPPDLPHGALAATWSGEAWNFTSPVDPSGDVTSNPGGLSCPDPDMCMVTMEYLSRTGTTEPVAAIRTGGPGSPWQSLDLANAVPAISSIGTVSCVSATTCVAMGDGPGVSGSVAAVWNGVAWAPTPALPATGGFFDGLSCLSASFCMATGWIITSNSLHPLAAVWDGSTWTASPVVTPASNAELLSVSCVSTTFCAATGSMFPGSTYLPFAEVWNGSSWTISPTASRSQYSVLQNVSCVSARHCVATGSYAGPQNRGLAMVETFNGTRWAITELPQPPSGQGSLYDIDCQSTTRCVAVGEEITIGPPETYVPMVEELSDGVWSVTSGVGLTGPDELGDLRAVSCTSFCEVVGEVQHSRDHVNSQYVPHVITLTSS